MKVANEFEKILVAVDGSPQAMRATGVAMSLAKKYGSELTALYVIHIPFGESLYPRSLWYNDFIDDIVDITWNLFYQRRGYQ